MKLFILCSLLVAAYAWEDDCGVAEVQADHPFRPQIVGGEEASPGQLPWQVSLVDYIFGFHTCGGVIINKNWIMTAAHCVDFMWVSGIVGQTYQSAPGDSASYVEFDDIIVHPEYGIASAFDADIALLKLAAPLEYNTMVKPACKPAEGEQFVGVTATASGWGSTAVGGSTVDELRYVEKPITTNEDCQVSYSDELITPGMVCAGDFPNNDKDSCQGDSGGPLTVVNEIGKVELVGLVSWGYGCASGFPGVYTRVNNYSAWVDSIIN